MSGYPPYPSYPSGGPTVVVAPPRCSTAHIVVAWILAALTFAYLLPWAVAATRSHRNVGGIALVNVFLGWSLVGWIVSLVWAVSTPQPQVVVVNSTYPVSYPSAYPISTATPPVPYAVAPPASYPQLTAQPYPYSQPSAQPHPYSQPSAQPHPYSQPSAQPYPYSPPSATRAYPVVQPSADQWQPAPWDRPFGPEHRG